jgi:hypothetical protein
MAYIGLLGSVVLLIWLPWPADTAGHRRTELRRLSRFRQSPWCQCAILCSHEMKYRVALCEGGFHEPL